MPALGTILSTTVIGGTETFTTWGNDPGGPVIGDKVFYTDLPGAWRYFDGTVFRWGNDWGGFLSMLTDHGLLTTAMSIVVAGQNTWPAADGESLAGGTWDANLLRGRRQLATSSTVGDFVLHYNFASASQVLIALGNTRARDLDQFGVFISGGIGTNVPTSGYGIVGTASLVSMLEWSAGGVDSVLGTVGSFYDSQVGNGENGLGFYLKCQANVQTGGALYLNSFPSAQPLDNTDPTFTGSFTRAGLHARNNSGAGQGQQYTPFLIARIT